MPRETDWALDNLGNWSADESSPYESVVTTGDFDGDGTWETGEVEAIHHDADSRNRLSELHSDPYNGSLVETAFVHDPNGNLVSDGLYYYQYDAWGRLLQVNALGTVTLDADGQVDDPDLLGDLLVHYVYDGLGRLIRRVGVSTQICDGDANRDGAVNPTDVGFVNSRINCPVGTGNLQCDNADQDANGVVNIADKTYVQNRFLVGCPADVEHEEYYYDGLRRIQDLFELSDVSNTRVTDREYVYGADDLDELLLQVDHATERAYWFLQDANLNVLALVNASGVAVHQYTYDAYGQVLAAEQFRQHAVNRLGHQGLFYERLTALEGKPVLSPAAGGITLTNPAGFYLNRNRTYDPSLGRFLQADPNASALPMLTAYLMSGSNPSLDFTGFDMQGHYGDGLSLYQYAGSNPVTHRNPLGVDMWDDVIDNLEAEITGHKLYSLDAINTGAKWAPSA